MAPRKISAKRTLLLACTALFLFASLAIAQQNNNPPAAPPPLPAPTTANNAPPSPTDDNEETTTAKTTTTAAPPPNLTAETSTTKASTTTKPTDNGDHPPPLPTLAGQYSYPPPAVPPTNNAPYMKPNAVPEGTFFIAVGAILGAIGLSILVWRAIVACLLHRSVKKAAFAQTVTNDKASFPAPPAPFYKYTDHESSLSLGQVGTAGRGVRRTQRGPIPSSTPSQTNLFFSPTAPGANSNGNRDSRFLPSGFYAAGSGSQGAITQTSISLSNLSPEPRSNGRPVGHSPPESPGLMPHHANNSRRNLSTSTLNLNRPVSGRAPSAFLEDLLDDQPDQFPPSSGSHQSPGRPH